MEAAYRIWQCRSESPYAVRLNFSVAAFSSQPPLLSVNRSDTLVYHPLICLSIGLYLWLAGSYDGLACRQGSACATQQSVGRLVASNASSLLLLVYGSTGQSPSSFFLHGLRYGFVLGTIDINCEAHPSQQIQASTIKRYPR